MLAELINAHEVVTTCITILAFAGLVGAFFTMLLATSWIVVKGIAWLIIKGG